MNALLSLINQQSDIDKISLYSKDLYQPKFLLLINKGNKVGLILFNDPMIFYWILKWYDIVFVYGIVFDDMTSGMISNKRCHPIVNEQVIRSKKLNTSLVFLFNHTTKHHKGKC